MDAVSSTLTSVTTMIAVLSIYLFGGGLIQSFALAMVIGILVGTYSSVFVASPVMMLISKWSDEREASQREASRTARAGSARK